MIKTIEEHLQNASEELKDLFYRIDNEIMSINSKIERYTTNQEIIYKSSLNFVAITIQNRKNCLFFLLRTINDNIVDNRNLTKKLPHKSYGNLTRQLTICPLDEKEGKYQINDIIDLIIQSYNSTQSATFKEAAVEILKDSDIPLSASEIWEEILKRNLVDTKGKTPVATLTTILLYSSNNSDNVTFHYKTPIFTIVSENPNKYDLIEKRIKLETEIIDSDNDDVPDIIENQPFYECVLDDKSTILQIFNESETLTYKTKTGNSFTYFFPDEAKAQIKIGKTNNVENRFNTLKTGNPDINIDLVLPSDVYEKTLHNRFEKYHHKLEWYFYSKEIRQFISNEKKKRQLAIDCYREYNESISIENEFLKHF